MGLAVLWAVLWGALACYSTIVRHDYWNGLGAVAWGYLLAEPAILLLWKRLRAKRS